MWLKNSIVSRFVFLLCFPVLSGGVRGEAFLRYQYKGSFSLPAGATMFDALNDGRIIAISGADVYVETEPESGAFSLTGTLAGADLPSFGAAFLRVSPDGTRFAIGNNGGSAFNSFRVGVFNVDDLAGEWFHAAHYDAAWVDNDRLAITAGDFGSPAFVSVLDLSSNPETPDNRTVIELIGGSSSGIAFDAQGNLFTGNGFAGSGPSSTGMIRAFSSAAWESAYAGGPVVQFETDGALVAELLSASPLDFDGQGNLVVGGGDFSQPGETDFVALIRAPAIAASLSGLGPADPGDPWQIRRLDPDESNDFNYFFVTSDPARSRLYVKDVSETTVHVYFDPSSFATTVLQYAPAPGQFVDDPDLNDPLSVLGPPCGGGTSAPCNESVVTLGGFGGHIVLGFDHTVRDEPLNPLGLDAIVFGNAYWVGGDPDRHWAECATIEISRDDNGNGLADDAWYLIPGSHLAAPILRESVTWTNGMTTYAHELPDPPFGATIIENPHAGTGDEGIFGYAEYSPTLLLGDLDGDDVVDDKEMTPEAFYTVPDDPFETGITPGSGGGDGFDIAWAVDAASGEPAGLDGFDFLRLTTPLHVMIPVIGEKSAEIDAVADVSPDPMGDANGDGDIDLLDTGVLQRCFGAGRGFPGCQGVALRGDGVIGGPDAAHVFVRMTGP